MAYEATWESLSGHQAPDWFHNDKLGILVVWGLFSVPGWAPLTGDFNKVVAREGWQEFFRKNPYAEWYMNTMRIEGSPTQQHHLQTYGPDVAYDDFAPIFNQAVEKWDPESWADLFERAGVRYVVFLTKHHDGFLLWPSRHPNPHKQNYQIRRDAPAELGAALRRRGMRLGLYYSGGLDWSFEDRLIQDHPDVFGAVPQSEAYVAYANSHWRELIDRYQPSVLWNDIAYPAGADLAGLFAYYYNQVPEGVINDRFAQSPSQQSPDDLEIMGPPVADYYDFRTPEYTAFRDITREKWEATRGLAHSFSYNQNERPDNYLSVEALVRLFVDVVSKNGNLLLSFGPTAEGAAPALQRERLEGLGAWLAVNGEAMYGSRPWVAAEGRAAGEIPVRFTQKEGALYATLLGAPAGPQVSLASLRAEPNTTVQLLGRDNSLLWQQIGGELVVTLPTPVEPAPAYCLKITPPPVWLGA